MKVSLRIFRMSRKVLMIVGGVLLLSGVAGATAVYIGKDRILGSSAVSASAIECTSAEIVKIHRKDRFWIRKYIRTEPADGLTRVKTALRVAAAVFEQEKPDLVQVVVLDAAGPTARSDMSGHAVGADVIYVPHPEKLASLEGTPVLQAKYTDGMASAVGEFYGEKMHMPEEDAAHYIASLTEKTDCLAPPVPEGAAATAGEGEGKTEGEGKAKAEDAKAGGEGEAQPTAEGEAKPAGEGDAKPAAEGEAKPAEGEAAKSDSAPVEKPQAAATKGWFASIKGMVFGSGETAAEATPAAGKAIAPEGEPAKSEGEAAKPVEDSAGAGGEAVLPSGEASKTTVEPAAPAEEPAPEASAQPHPAVRVETAAEAKEKPVAGIDAFSPQPLAGEGTPAQEAANPQPPSPGEAAPQPHG